MDFDEWFATNGYDEQYRVMFHKVWDEAQDAMYGEDVPVYLTPEERAQKQRELNDYYTSALHNMVIGKPRNG